ncbi:DUF4469 domain-containing protein [Flammeovirga yaeyamensis]|uniref:DUF4469 domain-containing protein n=1 Tax=Flammeovirga yaeyamensis TaxID=367791 RepID=A0AAX1NAB8_9BACT|nr:DUF4469 domain-containing protein [Flammeovirga yaeyamensis]MBB3697518.1 flagellar hook assembly protein FlgD [Flammeovirga yaeyamensis]NMF36214.1 DUF4469 domain-containing protein [Flammeovirga yaeyamensis]QWG02943.1 DUF4469 domain-containing protein [Flammeovirga yaeyamensis]
MTDSLTGDVNNEITPNNAVTLFGDRIKIEGDEAHQEEVGLFFVNLEDQSKTKVSQLISNENKAVIFMVPTLPKGNYELELVSLNKLIKSPIKEHLKMF